MELEIQPKIPPVFMFGHERSGTTLLGMMVGAHPLIAVPFSVTGLWFRYASRLDDYDGLLTRKSVERMVDDLLDEERIKLWDVQLDRSALLSGISQGDYPSVVRCFHSCYAAYRNKPFWGNLDIATLDHLDVVNRWFPDAKFVHIIRDGRDVALSHKTYLYGASNILECAENWANELHTNLKMGAMINKERYCVVRYEDLVLDSAQTLRHLCKVIGIQYSDDMLMYYQEVNDRIPEARRWLWPDICKAPVAANACRWRDRMSVTERVIFEDVAGDMLRKHGYDTYEKLRRSLWSYIVEMWYYFGRGHRIDRLLEKFGLGRSRRRPRQEKCR